jgi:hypothetical protein
LKISNKNEAEVKLFRVLTSELLRNLIINQLFETKFCAV